jgi:hypothetical protein
MKIEVKVRDWRRMTGDFRFAAKAMRRERKLESKIEKR